VPDSASNPNAPAVREDSQRVASLRWVGWLGWIIAALAIAAAIYFVHHSMVLRAQVNAADTAVAQLQSRNARYQELMDALTSPDSNRIRLTETRRPQRPAGHVTYLARSGALVFVASHLRQLPQKKTYELWLFPSNGTAPVSAGLFRPAKNGSTSVVLPPLPKGVEARAFAVTVEEAQGSETPSLPFIMYGH
jgi:anti-sigma-K factor RskA